MFDNLRDDPDSSTYEEDDIELFPEEEDEPQVAPKPKPRQGGRFLGMTSFQRFIIALMLMIATCTLSIMCLFVTGKVGIF